MSCAQLAVGSFALVGGSSLLGAFEAALAETLTKSSVVLGGKRAGKLVRRMRWKYLASLTEVAPILCTKMVILYGKDSPSIGVPFMSRGIMPTTWLHIEVTRSMRSSL
eukprot:scaffold4438_cov56-Cyclotella_meneghiniana.AAC.11